MTDNPLTPRLDRLEASLDGNAYLSRARDEKLAKRIAAVEQATLELAAALCEAGIEVGRVGSLPSLPTIPAPPSADVSFPA